MEKRKSKRGNFEIEDLGNFELPQELDTKIQTITAAADAELDATRVNFRWQKEPLALVRQVAHAMGIPYQTYIKQVVFRQALKDLEHIRAYTSAPTPLSPAIRKEERQEA